MTPRLGPLLTVVTEGVVLFLVLFSAWPFGSVHQYFQWVLLVAVAVLLALWALRAVLERRARWVACPVAVGLALLCLLGMTQVVPLSPGWVEWLSPQTAAVQQLALPTAQELDQVGLSAAAGRTLSFDAAATRACLLQLVAILSLFAAVRNNLRSPGCFYRLAWLATANGVLLALVGMGQLASGPPNVVLWSFHTDGEVFGPFICRNHFAYYANLCLGLAGGLLLGTRYFLAAPRPERAGWARAGRDMLRDPRVLWLAACLAILGAGLVACLSRGGVFGLCGGAAVAVLLRATRRATPRWALTAGVLVGAALLAGGLGFDRVSRRWEQVLTETAGEGRPAVWARGLELAARFPLTGTGLGTFGVAEPHTRRPGDPANVVWDHAHNDFVELWAEGGTPQLLVALAVIALVVASGVRAFRRHGETGLGRLALGGLVGFVAVAVQSVVDFGLHVPAVAVLAAVVAALLANLAEAPLDGAADPAPAPAARPLAGLLQAAALLAVALFLVAEGRRAEQAERCRLAAWRSPDERQIAYLRAGLALAPARADLHVALADALIGRADRLTLEAQLFAALAPPPTEAAGLVAALQRVAGAPAHVAHHAADVAEARRQLVRAQQCSPLSSDVHQRLLKLALRRGDDPSVALARLERLAPAEPAVWYAAGLLAARRGDRGEVRRAWHHALRGGSAYLKEIAAAVPRLLSAAELLTEVLPPEPELIVAAADALGPAQLPPPERERFLRAALAALANPQRTPTAEGDLLAARVHARLGEVTAAAAAYERAVAARPWSAGWRLELGQFLHRHGRLAEARQQLLLVLTQQPDNHSAQVLYQRLLRDVAETQ